MYAAEIGTDVFAPVIATLANLLLQSGKFSFFPSCYKKAQVLPLLKKPD